MNYQVLRDVLLILHLIHLYCSQLTCDIWLVVLELFGFAFVRKFAIVYISLFCITLINDSQVYLYLLCTTASDVCFQHRLSVISRDSFISSQTQYQEMTKKQNSSHFPTVVEPLRPVHANVLTKHYVWPCPARSSFPWSGGKCRITSNLRRPCQMFLPKSKSICREA